MKFGLAPVCAGLAILSAGASAQNLPAPPPPPPPAALLTPAQSASFVRPGTLLRFQFLPGESQLFRITSNSLIAVANPNGTLTPPTKQRVETLLRETVQDIEFPLGIATVLLEPQEIHIAVNDKELELSDDQRAQYLSERTLRVSPTGEVLESDSSSAPQSDPLDPVFFSFLSVQSVFPTDTLALGTGWSGRTVIRDLNTPVLTNYSIASVDLRNGDSLVRIAAAVTGTPEDRNAGSAALQSSVAPLKRTLPSGVAPSRYAMREVSGAGEIQFDNTNGVLDRSNVILHLKVPVDQVTLNRFGIVIKRVKDKTRIVVDRRFTVVRLDQGGNPVTPAIDTATAPAVQAPGGGTLGVAAGTQSASDSAPSGAVEPSPPSSEPITLRMDPQPPFGAAVVEGNQQAIGSGPAQSDPTTPIGAAPAQRDRGNPTSVAAAPRPPAASRPGPATASAERPGPAVEHPRPQ